MMQVVLYYYLKCTNIQIKYATHMITILTLVGVATIFDDDSLVGSSQLFTSPSLLFSLLFVFLVLWVKNQAI